MSLQTEILADSPVFYAQLTEGTAGATAVDSSTGSHDGLYHGTGISQVSPGPLGGDTATGFTGASQGYVLVGHNTAHYVGDICTIEVFVQRPTSSSSGSLGNKGFGSWSVQISATGTIAFNRSFTSNIVNSTADIPGDNSWNRVAVTKNGSTVHIYLNKVDVTGTVTNDTLANIVSDLYVGTEGNGSDSPDSGSYFTGNAAHFALFPTDLSKARLDAHFDAAFPAHVTLDYSKFPKAMMRR